MNIATTGKRPSIEDLTILPTIARVPVELTGVTWPDGSPVVVEIKALTYAERGECLKAANEWDKKTERYELNNERWALEVVRRGLVVPAITPQQLAVLESLNAEIIDQLAESIIALGRLNPRLVDAELERLANARLAPDPNQATDAPKRRKRAAVSR